MKSFHLKMFFLLLFSSSTYYSIGHEVQVEHYKSKNKLNLINNTHNGSLHIDEDITFVLNANENLIVDGNIHLAANSKLILPKGSNLIVTGSMTTDSNFVGQINGFLLIKNYLVLGRSSVINGEGDLLVQTGAEFEQGSSIFDFLDLGSLDQRVHFINSAKEIGLGSEKTYPKKQVLEKDSFIIFHPTLLYYEKPAPMDAQKGQEMVMLQLMETNYGKSLVLHIRQPMQSSYRITLEDMEGSILRRKMVLSGKELSLVEEDLTLGVPLVNGNYMVKVRGEVNSYALPFSYQLK